jgi:hypothetical protein
MNLRSKSGWSLPLSLILVALVALTVVFWGFSVLLYVAAFVVAVTVLVWVSDKVRHSRKCPECQLAKNIVQTDHSDWKVWLGWRSHRATEQDRSVIAVFYREPGVRSKPDPYKLIAVSLENGTVENIELSMESRYRTGNLR